MTLPPAQRAVVERLAAGEPVRQIAERLGLQERTVRTYIQRAAAKLHGPLPPIRRLTVWWLNQREPAPE